MAKYELLICVADEADLSSGHKRKKEGDILAIRPYPWKWGRKEIDEGLIVIVNINRQPIMAEYYTKGDLVIISVAKHKAVIAERFTEGRKTKYLIRHKNSANELIESWWDQEDLEFPNG